VKDQVIARNINVCFYPVLFCLIIVPQSLQRDGVKYNAYI